MKSMYRGDSKSFAITIVDKDGLPVDITGHTLTLVVKETRTAITYLLESEITSFTDPTNGTTDITITGDESYYFPIGIVFVGVLWDNGVDKITVLDTTLQVKEPLIIPPEPIPN
jgi:hypothetical protein